jgi:hypothetical protein
MIEIVNAIENKDWLSVEPAINNFAKNPTITAGELEGMILILPSIVKAFQEQFIT